MAGLWEGEIGFFGPEGSGRGKGARCFDPKATADGRGSLEVRWVRSVE